MSPVGFPEERFDVHAPYLAAKARYQHFDYRHVGASGLLVSPIGLGLWHNFGDDTPFKSQREIVRYAFDHGVNHFDIANQYGPPPGAAEENFGRILKKDLRPYRSELVIATKAGWPQWPGPNGRLNGKKHLQASLNESLGRLGVDHVDLFYSHRYDPMTPIAETIGALDGLVRQGKALYVGISSYSAARTAEALTLAADTGTPLVVNQSFYSMLSRSIEIDLLTVLDEFGAAAVAFAPLAQGLLTDRYLSGYESVSRATARPQLSPDSFTDKNLQRIRALNGLASLRGQSLSQMALAWVLRDMRVASAVVGVSSVRQLEHNLAALQQPTFDGEELQRIDEFAVTDDSLDWWRVSSTL